MMFQKHEDFPSGCAVVFGANGGIGEAIVALLSERGTSVIACYRSNGEKAAALCQSLNDGGGSAMALECDVRDRNSVDSVFQKAKAKYGRVHSVISAIGPVLEIGPFSEASEQHFRFIVEADIIGFFNISQASVRVMRDSGGGSLTAITTPVIGRVLQYDAMSAIPKAAVTQMTKYIACEEACYGIRANTVAPGITNVGLVTGAVGGFEGPGKDMLEFADSITPLGRRAEGREIAEAAVFLASNRASYITGQALVADGGMTV
ncbi:MAG: NAD(P)-dependent dehydrogenase (short-subunit alcohol dehydrogenase family) [Zhongshania sp.]|jgi:NAD(P)-dependent dehydrogenase (short-subunit alcohol dehydrogenase family)|nr:SDR family oxidoreductase [Zhongshania sp.]